MFHHTAQSLYKRYRSTLVPQHGIRLVVDQLSNYHLSKNLLYILTDRLPEFDWFVNDRLNKVEESYRQPIRKFAQLSQYRYELEPFTKKDIEEFIKMFKGQ